MMNQFSMMLVDIDEDGNISPYYNDGDSYMDEQDGGPKTSKDG